MAFLFKLLHCLLMRYEKDWNMWFVLYYYVPKNILFMYKSQDPNQIQPHLKLPQMPSSRDTQLCLQSSLSLQAHRQYWQQYNYCTQRQIFHCFIKQHVTKAHGKRRFSSTHFQAWDWVVSRDNWFPTFREKLVVCNRRDGSFSKADSYFRRIERL